MSAANGYYEAFVNQRAYRRTSGDRATMAALRRSADAVLPGCQIRWAGSQRKGTAIRESDLDVCVETAQPVTVAARRALRAAFERDLGRPARVLSHAIRLPAHGGERKVDVAFANAAFGARPLPDPAPFHDARARQLAARGLKIWARASRLPHLPGWVVEALVLHLDQGTAARSPLDLFLRLIAWLDERATPQAVEAVLRPAAYPAWRSEWSKRLPGRIEAVRNQARALRRRDPAPEAWRSVDDVGSWMGQ